MPFFRKTTLTEARQFTGDTLGGMKICEWMVDNGYPWLLGNANEPEELYVQFPDGTINSKPDKGIWIRPSDGGLMIRTMEGDMRVPLGHWVMKGAGGEFYSCDPDIFANTYAEVTEDEFNELFEIDRNARAYGFEVGRGHPLVKDVLKLSPDNPFLQKDWAEMISDEEVSDVEGN